MKSADEFEAHLKAELLPRLAQAASERREALRKLADLPGTLRRAAWTLGPGFVGSLLLGDARVLLAGACIFGIWEIGRRLRSDFFRHDRARKRAILERVLECWDSSFTYSARSSLSRDEFNASRLWDRGYDYFSSEDEVRGRVGDTAFRMSEVSLSKKARKNQTVEIFRGVVFIADFNKGFESQLLVVPDRMERHLGHLARAVQRLGGHFGERLVELEDPEFEAQFAVYGSDPVEARYLLTPDLMRRLVRLRERFGDGMRVGFQKGLVVLILPLDRNLFWIPAGELTEADLRRWVGELLVLTELIDALDLNTRIWSKGGR